MLRKTHDIIGGIVIIPLILLGCTMIFGWVANIVQICHMINDPITVMFILKCVGIFVAPIGSVLGIVGIF